MIPQNIMLWKSYKRREQVWRKSTMALLGKKRPTMNENFQKCLRRLNISILDCLSWDVLRGSWYGDIEEFLLCIYRFFADICLGSIEIVVHKIMSWFLLIFWLSKFFKNCLLCLHQYLLSRSAFRRLFMRSRHDMGVNKSVWIKISWPLEAL